ncbi:desulfoferrodoxin family protein [Clostridium sp. LP20]|uniref:desulfoferrodoxin family protein n=1 Tax=Clostridium sp. LP20 TaxID=3418665 RepID=UPI003EE617FD
MNNNDPDLFYCKKCNVIIEEICGNKSDYSCCGKKLTRLVADTTDGAEEKHLPIVELSNNILTVNIGSVSHPMQSEHSIEWVYLKTQRGSQRYNLKPNEEPIVQFLLSDSDIPIAVYSYCNLHGLWRGGI